MANQPSEGAPKPTAKSPQEEADALLNELAHPPDPYHTEPEPEPTAGEQAVSVASGIVKAVLNWLVTPAAIVLVLHFFVFQAYQVDGKSMEPTLQNSDYLIVSKFGQSIAKLRKQAYVPQRGDVVVFRFPDNPRWTFVKRVIAVPGERVVVKNGKITVFNDQNPEGFNPDKDYKVSDPITLGSADMKVPKGNIFVVGDNRSPGGSYDSREWGALPSSDIIGVAWLRLLPISGIRFLSVPIQVFQVDR